MAGNGLTRTAAAAAVTYALGDLASGLLYDGYSFRDQAISELTAFGSPVRPLMLTAMLIHGALLLAFAAGVLRLADRRSLRWAGALLVVVALVGVPTQTLWAMTPRGGAPGFNDTMHVALTALFGLLVAVAVVLAAVARRGWFRPCSLATLALLIGSGAATAFAMGGPAQGDTPWAGAFERIDAYAYLAWLVAFARALRRPDPRAGARGPRHGRATASLGP